MCALPISPGVYSQIKDESEFIQQIQGTTGFTLILSEKGEDNTLTYVSSQAELINKFGSPNMKIYGQALYNAFNFLSESGSFYLIRPLPTVEDATALNESLPKSSVSTPWVDKPASFAGAVIGYSIAQDTKSEDMSYFDSYIKAIHVDTISGTVTTPYTITLPFTFTSGEELIVYASLNKLIEGIDYTITLPNKVIIQTAAISKYALGFSDGDITRIFKVSKGTFDTTTFDLSEPILRYVPLVMDASFYSDPSAPTTIIDFKTDIYTLYTTWNNKTTYNTTTDKYAAKNNVVYSSLINQNKGNDPELTYVEETVVIPTYNNSTTYNKDDFAIYNDKVYQSLIDSNIGNMPSDGVFWIETSIAWRRMDSIINVKEFTTFPITVYTSFSYIPKQNQLKVYIDNTEITDYIEINTGKAIYLTEDSGVTNGSTVKIEKRGNVPLVRFTDFSLDPVSDENINHNAREVATDTYAINNKPSNNNWIFGSWTYNVNSLTSSTLLTYFKPLIVFMSRGRGKYGNNFQIKIAPIFSIPNHYTITVLQVQPLFNTEVILETFNVSFIPGTSLNGESTFIEDIINKYSEYIYVYTDPIELTKLSKLIDTVDLYYNPIEGTFTTLADPTEDSPITILDRLLSVFYVADATTKTVSMSSSISLTGGNEGCLFGIDGITPNSIVVDRCYNQALNGIYDPKILDVDSIFIDVLLDANFSANIKNDLLTLAKKRGDCYVEADLPKAVTVKQAVDNRLRIVPFNSYLVSFTAPFAKVESSFEGKEIVVSPSYFISSIIPSSDRVSEVWFAAAGPNRGVINTPIKKLMFTPVSQDDLDLLYLNQINPIVYKSGRYLLFSQLTSQRKSSALQDKNIVRLILFLNRVLKRMAFEYLMEPNDKLTWDAVQNNISQFLADIARRRGLYSYSVNVGASDYEIKQKMFHVNIIIKPTRVTEKILLNFVVR